MKSLDKLAFGIAGLILAGSAMAAVGVHVQASAGPTIVRTFTTSVGTHYFNGTQLVTCTPTGACAAQ